MKNITNSKNNKIKNIETFFAKIQSRMENLYSRWHDEHEYENIQNYKNLIQKWADDYDIKILAIKKRPFSFIGEFNDMKFKIKITAKEYSLTSF